MSKGNDLATRKLAEDLANENWKIICTFLPSGWMEQARQCGALQRARGIPDAEKLLRLLLIHVVNGCSLSETAVRAAQMGLHVSAVAVFKRLQAAEEWLRWLAAQQLGTKRLRFENRGRPLRAVDATSVSEPGSTGTDWRVHYSISLADLRCDFFELTAIEHGGETLRRVPVHRGDIMMGDRIYANPVAVSHVVDAKGDILVRKSLAIQAYQNVSCSRIARCGCKRRHSGTPESPNSSVVRCLGKTDGPVATVRQDQSGASPRAGHAGSGPERCLDCRPTNRAEAERGGHSAGTQKAAA